jgi:predicted Zn-dependent peptidase
LGPTNKSKDALKNALFPVGHPLRRPVGGTHASLDSLKLDDAAAFVGKFYRPPNMVAVVSGDFDLAQVDDLVAMLPPAFQGDRAHPIAPVHLTEWPARLEPARGEKVVHLVAPVSRPEVWIAWPLPPAGRDKTTNEVLLRLLQSMERPANAGSFSDAESVHQEISRGSGSMVTLNQTSMGSWVMCGGQLADDVDPDRAVEGLVQRYAELWLGLDWDHEWFENNRALVVTSFALDSSRLDDRLALTTSTALFDSSLRFNDVLAHVMSTARIDVAKVATNYIVRPKARAVIVSPSGDVPPPSEARPSFEKPHSDLLASAIAERGAFTEHELLDFVHPIGAAQAHVQRLANGLEVIVLPRPGLPVSTIAVAFHISPSAGGAVENAVSYAAHADHRHHPTDLGVVHSMHLLPDLFVQTSEVLAHDEANAIDLEGRSIRSFEVEWPSHIFFDQMPIHEAAEATPDGRVSRGFAAALWGGHPYGARPSAAQVEDVASSDVEAWAGAVVAPNNGVLVAVGDVDPAAIFLRAEQELGAWNRQSRAISQTVTPTPPLNLDQPLRVFSVRKKGVRSSVMQLGCLLPPVDHLGQAIANEILATLLRNVLLERLRQQTGASYSPSAVARYYRGGSATLVAKADVNTRDLPSARAIVEALMDSKTPAPFTADDFEVTRLVQAKQSTFRYGTSDALVAALVDNWNMGWAPAVLDEYPSRLAAVTWADVEHAFAVCRSNAVLTVLGGAP